MYREHRPGPALRPYVACCWTKAGAEVRAQRVLPDGCVDLLLDLGRGTARIVGAMTGATVAPGGAVDIVAVRFRPGEAPAVLGLSAAELTDRTAPLEDLWGAAGRDLAEELAQVPRSDRLARLERHLVARIGTRWTDWRVRRAVAAIQAGAGSIPAVAGEVGVGERHLERLFADRVGLGPKRFARIVRLQRAVVRPEDLATVAVRHGFSDPSHVVREFRALCGVPPGRLWAEMSETSNGEAAAPDTATSR